MRTSKSGQIRGKCRTDQKPEGQQLRPEQYRQPSKPFHQHHVEDTSPTLKPRYVLGQDGSTHTGNISNYREGRCSSCVPPSANVSSPFHALNETCNSLGCQVVNDPGRRIILLCQPENRRYTYSTPTTQGPSAQHWHEQRRTITTTHRLPSQSQEQRQPS